MKAITFHETGGPEVLQIEEVATPEPREGEVLIKTAYAGINFSDVGRRMGIYPVPKFPFIPGLEGSGIVEALGPGVTGVSAGARVLAFGAQGSYAEYFLAKGEKTFSVPATMTMDQAATIGQIFITSWNALVRRAKLQRGESILVQSAGNGAGIAAVQIAKHLGARVIGTASNAEKLELAKEMGADDLINYAEADFVAEVSRLTDGQGVDVVLDGIGGKTFGRGMKCLAPNGRILSLGYSGGDPTIQFHAFDLAKGVVAMGGPSGIQVVPRGEFEQVLRVFKEGQFRPVPVKVFSWSAAVDAHRYLEERRGIGKIALQVG